VDVRGELLVRPRAECQRQSHAVRPLSESERTEPHLLAVFELIVQQQPAFTRFIRQDEWYGWAQEGEGRREFELATGRPLGALLAAELRRRRRQRTRT
jgi:hypothetical protein